MKVKQLIRLLKDKDPEAEVVLKENGDEGYFYALAKVSKTKRNKVFILVGKSAFNFVMKACGLKNIRCSFCKVKITKNNFGWISKDKYSCNNIFCLMKATRDEK